MKRKKQKKEPNPTPPETQCTKNLAPYCKSPSEEEENCINTKQKDQLSSKPNDTKRHKNPHLKPESQN